MVKKIKDKIADILFAMRQNGIGKIIIILLLVISVSAVSVFFIEHKGNVQFKSLFDSVWYTIVTLSTVGYGDKAPITPEGRAVGILIILFGVAVTGAVTGRIASALVEKQMKAGQGLGTLNKLENHFIICGWKPELPRIIKDILKVNPSLKMDHIVVISSIDPQKIQDLKADRKFAKLHFIYGDFTDESVLLRANIKKAKTVIVLADHTHPGITSHEIDSKTVMAVMTIDNITKDIYSCAEIYDSKFEKYLKLSYCDEIILSRDYSRIMLANASSTTGVSHVINQVIDVNSDTPIKVVDLPDGFIGKKYGELSEYSHKKKEFLLVGLLENTGNIFQRKREALKEAQKTPDISKLVDNLQNVKNIKPNEPVINPEYDYEIKRHSKMIIIPKNKNLSQG